MTVNLSCEKLNKLCTLMEFFAFMNWSNHKITNRIAVVVVPSCVKLLSEIVVFLFENKEVDAMKISSN